MSSSLDSDGENLKKRAEAEKAKAGGSSGRKASLAGLGFLKKYSDKTAKFRSSATAQDSDIAVEQRRGTLSRNTEAILSSEKSILNTEQILSENAADLNTKQHSQSSSLNTELILSSEKSILNTERILSENAADSNTEQRSQSSSVNTKQILSAEFFEDNTEPIRSETNHGANTEQLLSNGASHLSTKQILSAATATAAINPGNPIDVGSHKTKQILSAGTAETSEPISGRLNTERILSQNERASSHLASSSNIRVPNTRRVRGGSALSQLVGNGKNAKQILSSEPGKVGSIDSEASALASNTKQPLNLDSIEADSSNTKQILTGTNVEPTFKSAHNTEQILSSRTEAKKPVVANQDVHSDVITKQTLSTEITTGIQNTEATKSFKHPETPPFKVPDAPPKDLHALSVLPPDDGARQYSEYPANTKQPLTQHFVETDNEAATFAPSADTPFAEQTLKERPEEFDPEEDPSAAESNAVGLKTTTGETLGAPTKSTRPQCSVDPAGANLNATAIQDLIAESLKEGTVAATSFVKVFSQPNTKRILSENTEQTQSKYEANTEQDLRIELLAGNERLFLDFVFAKCKQNASLTTGPVPSREIATALGFMERGSKAAYDLVSNLIYRVTKKGYVQRVEAQKGKAGWTIYQISRSLYLKLLNTEQIQSEYLAKYPFSAPITLPIIKNHINSNKGGEVQEDVQANPFDQVSVESLNEFGITRKHLYDIFKNKWLLSVGELEAIVDRFPTYARTEIKNPSAKNCPSIFLAIVKSKAQTKASVLDYVDSPEDALMAEQMRMMMAKKAQRERQAAELRDASFEDWRAEVFEEQFKQIAGPMASATPAVRERILHSYFIENVWPERLAEIKNRG